MSLWSVAQDSSMRASAGHLGHYSVSCPVCAARSHGRSFLKWADSISNRILFPVSLLLCVLWQPLAFSEPLFPHLRITIRIKGDIHKNCLAHSLANRQHLTDVRFSIINYYDPQCAKYYAKNKPQPQPTSPRVRKRQSIEKGRRQAAF